MYSLLLGDCLEEMARLPDQCIDLVLCDLPYGTTANKWDTIIPLDLLWKQYKRVAKGAIVLTATQPFSSALVLSNPAWFKYEWVWVKTKITGVLNAKKQPVRKHEQILVFYNKQPTYNAQGIVKKGTITKQGRSSSNYNKRTEDPYIQEWSGWPRDVIEIASEGKTVHPTQKPVALMEYLINTYSNPGELVLDNCMGGGTTGVAALRLGRNFIGIEKDPTYFAVAQKRISEAVL